MLSLRPHRQGEASATVKDITDKGYYTNSYHVDVREKIDAFSKFAIESQFQQLSTGGAISYVEIPNMRHNLTALKEVVRFIYDNIQYAEFNTKSDYCQVCGYDGEIIINDDLRVGVPLLRQQGPDQDERHPPYLRLSGRELLECGQDQGDQEQSTSSVMIPAFLGPPRLLVAAGPFLHVPGADKKI